MSAVPATTLSSPGNCTDNKCWKKDLKADLCFTLLVLDGFLNPKALVVVGKATQGTFK